MVGGERTVWLRERLRANAWWSKEASTYPKRLLPCENAGVRCEEAGRCAFARDSSTRTIRWQQSGR